LAYLLLDDRDAIGRQLIDGEERANLAALLLKHGVTAPRVEKLRRISDNLPTY
jgi:hypothetical protein